MQRVIASARQVMLTVSQGHLAFLPRPLLPWILKPQLAEPTSQWGDLEKSFTLYADPSPRPEKTEAAEPARDSQDTNRAAEQGKSRLYEKSEQNDPKPPRPPRLIEFIETDEVGRKEIFIGSLVVFCTGWFWGFLAARSLYKDEYDKD